MHPNYRVSLNDAKLPEVVLGVHAAAASIAPAVHISRAGMYGGCCVVRKCTQVQQLMHERL